MEHQQLLHHLNIKVQLMDNFKVVLNLLALDPIVVDMLVTALITFKAMVTIMEIKAIEIESHLAL